MSTWITNTVTSHSHLSNWTHFPHTYLSIHRLLVPVTFHFRFLYLCEPNRLQDTSHEGEENHELHSQHCGGLKLKCRYQGNNGYKQISGCDGSALESTSRLLVLDSLLIILLFITEFGEKSRFTHKIHHWFGILLDLLTVHSPVMESSQLFILHIWNRIVWQQ